MTKLLSFSELLALLGLSLFIGCRDYSTSFGSSPSSETSATLADANNANGQDITTTEQELFEKVNEERAKVGLKPLAFSKELADCARAHSNDMHDRGFFSHINPDGWGPTQRGIEGRAGYCVFEQIVPCLYYGVAENIAMGCANATEVINLWMNSPAHKDNILNSAYTHMGVGVCSSNFPNPDCKPPFHHWTLNFGTRGAGN
jgi:uncharacterized protein YkwD